MSRFDKGQTVWTGRDEHLKELVVDRVIDNKLLPVFQYTFEAPNNGWACGEQSLRDTPDGADLKMSECYKENHIKDNVSRVNTMASALRQVVGEDESGLGISKLSAFDDFRVDFKPDLNLVKWLVKHANGRLIIHVGSGQGHLVNMIKCQGRGRAIGIEPNIDKMEWIQWRLHRDDMSTIDINEILDGRIEDYAKLLTDLGKDKAMVIIARPKVMDFVKTTYDLMPKGMEMLYVTEEGKNLIARPCELLDHEGCSEDDEVIYSLIK